jgi:hypothetical protein
VISSERLQVSQWILERNLHWIAAAEVKTGVIVALDTAMLGVLAAAFSALEPVDRAAWANLFSALTACCLGAALMCARMSVLPRTQGPPSSFIFFGRIVAREAADYAEAFRKATEAELLDDCLAQIHRNAQIAQEKHEWVRAGMMWSFLAVPLWALALGALIRI